MHNSAYTKLISNIFNTAINLILTFNFIQIIYIMISLFSQQLFNSNYRLFRILLQENSKVYKVIQSLQNNF